ncbi:brefeldin A-inhibited guanine nucleotide-exchange protein 3-like isoform X2 [Bolinopsis microptera]|uniref:brefeldin A-inhibited guanine nucleotide-exchange protein 3-like isoform X2 n=1 Tax=Bolinopsis microptera TaxID=2820187 RepID=UPI003079FD73
MLIDGVTQSSLCGDSTMLGMSASVIVALLDSIQQLSNSNGVTIEHMERISGAIEDMDSQLQSYDAGEDESETVSETEDIFTPGPAPPVQTFFTAESDAETHTTDLVRTERTCETDEEEEGGEDKQVALSEEVDVTDSVFPQDTEIPVIPNQSETLAKETEDATPASSASSDNEEEDKQSAKEFIKSLLQFLSYLLHIEDPHTLDLSIQQFASDMCAQVRQESVQLPLLNADSVYVATYMSLDLTRRLHQAHYYTARRSSSSSSVPVSESQFVEWVQGSGGVILVSPIWLQEIYKTILEVDLLTLSEWDMRKPSTLLSLLEKFSQVQKNTQPTSPLTPCQRFARFLLSGTWEEILQVLQNPIEAPHKLKARLSEVWAGSKSLTTRTDLICCCLDGLRRAATLSCKLGMQNKCTTVISHLANISCSSVKRLSIHKEQATVSTDNAELRVAHVLSMDAVLNVGLDVGQFEPKCWKHVFKCCAYISLLEHTKFAHSKSEETVSTTSTSGGTLRELMMSEEASEGGVAELLQQETQQFDITNTPRGLFSGTYSGVLNNEVSTKAVALLASSADKLFSSAVSHLSTEPLSGGLGYCCLRGSLACRSTPKSQGPLGSFLEALVKSSQIQLFGRPLEHSASPKSTKAMSRTLPPVATSVLHLHRLTELVLLCSRSSHSLLNMMQVWSIVSTHFTEAACHADRTISKLAITSYHQILTEVMRKRVELPHFSFNETLLKPMEDMLSLGLCDMDTQDQIVSCLCELAEANARELKSGWKALFRSLRSVKVPVSNEEDTWTTPVFEVVSVVLERDDVFIFADAIIDCVLCLQKFICSGSVQQSKDTVYLDQKIESHNARLAVQLGLPSLKYLSRIATMLSIMYGLEQRPFFAGSDRIKVPAVGLNGEAGSRALFDFLPYNDNSGLLKVWWIMIEGMCGTVLQCHQQVQAQTMETVYSMLRALAIIPGPQFQILVMCHQLFPMLTSWVKRSSRLKWVHNENMESNFKHACGLAIELVSETITSLKRERDRYDFDTEVAINSLLQHVMVLLNACVKQPLEGIARVGCSCIRHLLFTTGKQLGDHLNVVCRGLADACNGSLEAVHLVLIPFTQPNRLDGGDNGLVRVYARKDTPSAVAKRLSTLTQQVFLNEQQYSQVDMLNKESIGPTPEEKVEQYMRSYVIAWPADRLSNKPSRVPFSDLVIGLLAHSLLVQTINDLFVGDKHPTTKSTTGFSELLKVLTPQTMSMLLDAVWDSYEVCIAFNHRPGLRYLIQKVGCLNDYTPGLVKQAQKSYITYINTILYLRINVKEQKREKEEEEGEGAERSEEGGAPKTIQKSSGNYSHAGLSLESIDTSWEGILDTCLKEASCQLCAAYSLMYSTQGQSSILKHKPVLNKKGSKKDLTLEEDPEAVQERFSVNDIEHWTSTVVSVLNMYYGLSDEMFRLLLPAIYPSTIELCVNVTDNRVRCAVKSILEKVGRLKYLV